MGRHFSKATSDRVYGAAAIEESSERLTVPLRSREGGTCTEPRAPGLLLRLALAAKKAQPAAGLRVSLFDLAGRLLADQAVNERRNRLRYTGAGRLLD